MKYSIVYNKSSEFDKKDHEITCKRVRELNTFDKMTREPVFANIYSCANI